MEPLAKLDEWTDFLSKEDFKKGKKMV